MNDIRLPATTLLLAALLTAGVARAASDAEPTRVLVTDPVLLGAKRERTVRQTVRREEALVVDAATLLDADALGAVLSRNPRMCTPPLGGATTAELVDLADADPRALYVSVPVGRGALAWRWERDTARLVRLTSNLDLDQDVSGRVLAVVEPAMDEGLGPGRRTLLPASHFALSFALADQLAEHPNECTPPLTVEQIAALDALHAQGADDLYVLMPMGRWRRLWKWDGEDLALTRLIP